ncbi:secreted RxLR effector protein 78-like [Nicotiana tabacum]|uniref:Secreted RxLR effector protein 78-like n=1 Tax=Nicotiana tabacum TaxID=4097 RepID=A0AC58SSA7_TOBAC
MTSPNRFGKGANQWQIFERSLLGTSTEALPAINLTVIQDGAGESLHTILLWGHELVKGYGRKGLSPRCRMELDMQKAYDSLEWVFIEQILIGLAFPDKFVKWIMSCLKIVSHSILVNGRPTTPFDAKKGLRQGDPLFPFLFVLAMEYLTKVLKTLR